MIEKEKQQRKDWWNKLSPDAQANYIKKQQEKKLIKQKLNLKEHSNKQQSCSECFHYKTQSCADRIVCKYFTIAGESNNPEDFPEITSDNKTEWLQRISAQNPWLNTEQQKQLI